MIRTTLRSRHLRSAPSAGEPPTPGAPAGGGGGSTTPPTPAPPAGSTPPTGTPSAPGFPANTAWKDMTTTEQVAYWRHQSQRHEQRAQETADYAAIKAENERLKKIEEAGMSADQKAQSDAVEAARVAGQQTGLSKHLPAAIREGIRDAAPHLSTEQITGLLTFAAPASFLDANGEIDPAKIAAAAALIPAVAAGQPPRVMNGGRPGSAPSASGLAAGADLYARRHGKQPA